MRNTSKVLIVAAWVALASAITVTQGFASSVVGYGDRVVVSASMPGMTDADRAVSQKLDTTIVSFTFSEQPLDEAMDFLGTLGGVNIVLDRAKVEAGKTVTLKLQNVTLRAAVKLVVEQVGLRWNIREGVILVSDAEGVKSEPITIVIDVSDFLAVPPQFIGPTIELPAIGVATNNGSRNGGQGFIITDTKGDRPKEDWEKSHDELLQELVDVIRQVIDPGSWDEPIK